MLDYATAIQGLDGGSSGGFDPSSLIQGFTGGSQASQASSGGIGNTVGGVGGAALGTLLLPGIGTALGGSIGSALGGLVGGLGGDKVGAGKGKFAGLHCSYMQPLDDSRLTNEDADKYIREANKAGLTVEEIAVWMARDSEYYHQTASTIWDGYSAGTSSTGLSAAEARQTIARYYGGRGEYPALVMYDRKPQIITLKATSTGADSPSVPIQTMSVAQSPTSNPNLGQVDQLAYRNPVLANSFSGGTSVATPPFVVQQPQAQKTTSASDIPPDNSTATDNTKTYALIGGGVAVLLLLAVLLFKK